MVAQLLEFHYNECHNMLEAVGRCLRRIEGSYALGIICADYPNALIAARKDSPLILGYGQNGNFIASDVTAIIKYTRDVVYMDDGEIAVLTADSVDVFDDEMLPVEKTHSTSGLGRVRGGEGRLSPTSCSRRSWSSRRPSARPSPPASGTAGWCWTICT